MKGMGVGSDDEDDDEHDDQRTDDGKICKTDNDVIDDDLLKDLDKLLDMKVIDDSVKKRPIITYYPKGSSLLQT